MGRSDHARLLVLLFSPWLLLVGYCDCQEQGPRSFFPVSSFSFPNKELGPYDWSYARGLFPAGKLPSPVLPPGLEPGCVPFSVYQYM